MKNKVVAALLALFLGTFGVHKFYLENFKSGILYLVLCWTGLSAIFAFIDAIIYFIDTEEKFQERVEAKKLLF